MIIIQELGGFFKYIVVDDNLAIVDPEYLEEYKECMKDYTYNLSK